MEETLQALEKLNKLALSDDEHQRVKAHFEFVEEQCAEVRALPLDDIDIMVHNVPLMNVLREDVAHHDIPRESLLAGAPETKDGYFQVPRLVD